MMKVREWNSFVGGCGHWVVEHNGHRKGIMNADVLRVASVLDIHRVRRLPFAGHVLVNEGESVQPEDVIAEVAIPNNMLMLDVAKGLGISPLETISCMVRDLGEALSRGDVVAQSEGPFPRWVRTPVDGTLVECHQGRAVLATGKNYVRIQAGMIAEVKELIPDYGAILTTRGSIIQGVWGNGQVGAGVLNVIESSFGTPINVAMCGSLESGQVIAAGVCLHAAVLKHLAELRLAGLILGSLAPELIPAAMGLAMPVIVLQGFGQLPFCAASTALLKSRADQIASLNACESDIWSGRRPEVIIPHANGEPEAALGFRALLAVGQQVRVLSGAALGEVGEVVQLPQAKNRFESGLFFYEAKVALENGDIIPVPRQNLVILG
jgi:hypothetical protein